MKRTKEDFEKVIKNNFSFAAACKSLNLKPCGGNYKTLHNKVIEFNIDISHFTGQGWNVGLKFRPMKTFTLDEILIENSNYTNTYNLKNKLFKENIKEKKCETCENTEWLGKPISLELHHINGINNDHRLENLKILCPNCHSQTPNYRRNKIK